MRYERKYRIEGLPRPWVEQALRLHPASFRELYPIRQVNNIYFDTPDLAGFQQNVAGTPQRRKHRLRWYGPQMDGLPSPIFEVKIKDGELGRKESQQLDSVEWPHLRQSFQQIPHLQYLPIRPVLVNAYERAYYASANQRFRITIDWNLRFAPFHWHQSPQHFHFLPDPAIVMEVKYDAAHDTEAQFIFEHLAFRQTKNSKYVTGINLVLG